MDHSYLRGYAEGILFALGQTSAERVGRPSEEPSPQAASPRFTIVYPPTVPWEHACIQRPHHLMRAFARRGHEVVFVDSVATGRKPHSPEAGLTVVSRDADLRGHLEARSGPLVLWVSCPPTWEGCRLLSPDVVVYDIIDEPVGELQAWQRGLPELQARADCCVAVTRALADGYAHGKPCVIGANGVWLEHFSPGSPVRPPAWPAAAGAGGRPVVGYWGALERWVDVELLVSLALARAQYDFVVIGPEYGTDTARQAFGRARNIHWVGAQPHEDLPAWGRCFDVGILPFKRTQLTDTCDPIKVREYLALGLPVVATALPGIADALHIRRGTDLRSWLAEVDDAVTESQQPKELRERLRGQRRESVREAGWQAIADRCLAHVTRTWEAKRHG